MKKMIALMAAVAVFGMGKIANAELPPPQSFMDVSILAYTETPNQYGEDGILNVQGGIYGDFGMQAYSGAENVPNTEQIVGTGVEVQGGSDLTLYDDDIVYNDGDEICAVCPNPPSPGQVIGQTGGSLGIELTGGGAAGYDADVSWAQSGSLAIVGSTGDAEGGAGIGAGAISSNGDVGAWSGSGAHYSWLFDD